MRRRSSVILAVLGSGLVLAAAIGGCGPDRDPWAGQPGPPRVVASFPPLTCFARNVGGDQIGLLTLATSRGPHDYDPTIEAALPLKKADLFLINGLELDEHFTDRMAKSSGNPKLGPNDGGVVRLGEELHKTPGLVDKLAAHDDHHGHGHEGHQHGEFDPHVWLGGPQARGMVGVIRDRLKKLDPAHADDYDRRATAYLAELQALEDEGKAMLAGKKERGIVTFHESLHYLAKTYGLTIEGVLQVRPGADADAATLAELVKTCKEKGVRVIATEPQFRQKGAAETLLKVLQQKGVEDAVLIEIDPLETLADGDTLDAGWYVRKMRANLEVLAKTLE